MVTSVYGAGSTYPLYPYSGYGFRSSLPTQAVQPGYQAITPHSRPLLPAGYLPRPVISWVPVLRQGVSPAPNALLSPTSTPSLVQGYSRPIDNFAPLEPEAPAQPKQVTPPQFSEVNASHILLKINDSSNEAEVLQQISALRQSILAGEYTFAEAAKKFSECPSSKSGGDLGYFEKGAMVGAFEEAAFDPSLNPGAISEPIRTDFGWHLIQVQDRR